MPLAGQGSARSSRPSFSTSNTFSRSPPTPPVPSSTNSDYFPLLMFSIVDVSISSWLSSRPLRLKRSASTLKLLRTASLLLFARFLHRSHLVRFSTSGRMVTLAAGEAVETASTSTRPQSLPFLHTIRLHFSPSTATLEAQRLDVRGRGGGGGVAQTTKRWSFFLASTPAHARSTDLVRSTSPPPSLPLLCFTAPLAMLPPPRQRIHRQRPHLPHPALFLLAIPLLLPLVVATDGTAALLSLLTAGVGTATDTATSTADASEAPAAATTTDTADSTDTATATATSTASFATSITSMSSYSDSEDVVILASSSSIVCVSSLLLLCYDSRKTS